MVDPPTQLEDSGCDAPRLRGFPHVRRSEGTFAEVLHYQARELCISIKLHEVGTVGNRLRHVRRWYPSNYTAQQEPLPGVAGRLPGRLVSISCVIRVSLFAWWDFSGSHAREDFIEIHDFKDSIFQLLVPGRPKYKSGLDMGGATDAGGAHKGDGGAIRVVLRDG